MGAQVDVNSLLLCHDCKNFSVKKFIADGHAILLDLVYEKVA